MTGFILNGAARVLRDVEPGRTVLEHLRLQERLTATKEGCAEGDCGACTVVIGRPDAHGGLNFQAVNSCIMLTSELDGTVVITADGLASNGVLDRTQQAIVASHGSQCGFCTPGFVMSLYACGQNPAPVEERDQREAIYDALSGNLCRCTGYRPIVDAAILLAHKPDPRVQAWRLALDALAQAENATAPRSMEALDVLLAAEPSAKLLGGGTDIGVGVAKHGQVPGSLISLRRVAGLNSIMQTDEALIIGATATYSEILPHLQQHFPAFANLVRRIGSVQIRNLGTMGGNICNASPIGDSAPCLIALNAQLLLRSAAGHRWVPIDGFFIGYRKTMLLPGEYLQAIKIPLLQPADKFFAYKIAKRFDQDISTVAAAFSLRIEAGKITAIKAGFGGMAATPMRGMAVEKSLLSQAPSNHAFTLAATAVALDFAPLTDFRATAAYRLQAASGLVIRLGAQLIQSDTVTDIWAL